MQQPSWDKEVESAVSEFEKSALASRQHVDTLHLFDKERFRMQTREKLSCLYEDIHQGYEVAVQTVIEMKGEQSGEFVKTLFPDQNLLNQFSEDPEQTRHINEEKPLYESLGICPNALSLMYEAACFLLDKDEDEKARQLFALLVVLAPHISDFWAGSGVALIRLKRFEEAIEMLEPATSLDRRSVQNILLLCRALVELGRRSEAEARISERLDQAARESDRELYEHLEVARFELSKFARR